MIVNVVLDQEGSLQGKYSRSSSIRAQESDLYRDIYVSTSSSDLYSDGQTVLYTTVSAPIN